MQLAVPEELDDKTASQFYVSVPTIAFILALLLLLLAVAAAGCCCCRCCCCCCCCCCCSSRQTDEFVYKIFDSKPAVWCLHGTVAACCHAGHVA